MIDFVEMSKELSEKHGDKRPHIVLSDEYLTTIDMNTGKETPPVKNHVQEETEKEESVEIQSFRNIIEANEIKRKREKEKDVYIEPNQSPFDIEIAKSQMSANSIKELVESSDKFTVDSEDKAKVALDMAIEARTIRKALEAARMKIVRPHLDFNASINQIVKDFSKTLDDITGKLTARVNTFEEGLKELYKKEGIEVPVKKIESTEAVPYEREKITIDVVDESKIPREYTSYDKRKAQNAVKLGIRKIPGLRIKVEKVTSYKTKRKVANDN